MKLLPLIALTALTSLHAFAGDAIDASGIKYVSGNQDSFERFVDDKESLEDIFYPGINLHEDADGVTVQASESEGQSALFEQAAFKAPAKKPAKRTKKKFKVAKPDSEVPSYCHNTAMGMFCSTDKNEYSNCHNVSMGMICD